MHDTYRSAVDKSNLPFAPMTVCMHAHRHARTHARKHAHMHTHNRFTASLDFVRDCGVSQHQKGITRKVKPICIYCSKR